MVRVSKATRDKLKELAARWAETEREHLRQGDRCQWDCHVSLEAVIEELIRTEEEHRKRSNTKKGQKQPARASEASDKSEPV